MLGSERKTFENFGRVINDLSCSLNDILPKVVIS